VIIIQKNTSFGGRTTDILNTSFLCVCTTAKDGIFSGLSTIMWLPEVAKEPVVKIKYADKTNSARRQSIHRDIAARLDGEGEKGVEFLVALDKAIKPFITNGEVAEMIVSDESAGGMQIIT